jgi:hypothetical protein
LPEVGNISLFMTLLEPDPFSTAFRPMERGAAVAQVPKIDLAGPRGEKADGIEIDAPDRDRT